MKNKVQKSKFAARTTQNALKTAAVAGFAMIGLSPASVWAIARDWNVGSGTWSISGNWTPSGSPGGLDSALIGTLPTAQNATVTLNTNPTVAQLQLSNGMTLNTAGFAMTAGASTSISGTNNTGTGTFNSRLLVNGGLGSFSYRTGTLLVSNGGRVDLAGNAILRSDSFAIFDNTSRLAGAGVINLFGNNTSAAQFDGEILPGLGGGLTINQMGTGKIDLDGGVGGDRTIMVTTGALNGSSFASFSVNGTALLDEYDDSFQIGGNNTVTMNLTDGWTLGGAGKIKFNPNLLFPGVARLNGSTVTLNGDIEFLAATHAQFNAPVVINPTMGTSIPSGGTLEFNGATTVNGGSFTLAEGAHMRFDGATNVKGGTFNTFSDSPFDGTVTFFGETGYSGTMTFNGSASQRGNATVYSNGAVINADRFDMDGPIGGPIWNLYGFLTVNADAIDTDSENTFNGTINVLPQGILGSAGLVVNLPSGQTWKSTGTINLHGPDFSVFGHSLNGSPFTQAGTMNVVANNVINARTNFAAGGLTTVDTGSWLKLDGGSTADPNTITGGVISGPGGLHVDGPRALVGHGTIATAVDFINGGELLAKGGALHINGNRVSKGILGTADASGILHFDTSWSMSSTDVIRLNGGLVDGAAVANLGLVSGHGTIANHSIANNKTLAASGGTLVIDTTESFDMDGALGGVPVVNVLNGDLHSKVSISDSFEGVMTVGPGRTARFDNGWMLASNGTLNLNGGFLPATVSGGAFQFLSGHTNVAFNGKFDLFTGFFDGSVTSIPAPSDQLTLTAGAGLHGTAIIIGNGSLRNAAGSTLAPLTNNFISVHTINEGRLVPAGDGTIGLHNLKTFTNGPTGTIAIDIGGDVVGTKYDRTNVVTGATVDGNLELNLRNAYDPDYLFSHAIIHSNGNGISGVFDTIDNIQITPTKYWAVTYGPNDVFATAALPGDANLDGAVDIGDFALLGANFNTPGPWAEADFNGDGLADIADFSLLAANFNTSVPLPRGAAVPEPATFGLCIAAALAGRRRRESN